MATSGTTTRTKTKEQLVLDVLTLIGVNSPVNPAPNETIQWVGIQLDDLLKDYNNQGIHLWKSVELALMFQDETSSYELSSASGTVCKESALISTTIGADEAAAQTSITVADSTGMATGDVCLIYLDDLTLHATTISSVTNATTIVIASALPSAASEDNYVFAYTASTDAPTGILKVSNMRIHYEVDDTDRLMQQISREDYRKIVNKAVVGQPTSYYVEQGLSAPVVHVWPVPDLSLKSARLTCFTSIEDTGDLSDTLDIPVELTNSVKYHLGAKVCFAFGKLALRRDLQDEGDRCLRRALAVDREPTTRIVFKDR